MKRLFGTRGIRGPISTKVTPELMLRLGLAISRKTNRGKIVVGRDARTSGEMLLRAFTAGALSGGSDVVEIGIVPSPCLAFTTRRLGASAGAMITASHNPPPDNGIAFYHGDGREFTSEDEIEMERLVLDEQPQPASWDSIGNLHFHSAIPPYIEAIKNQVKVEREIKVVVDCANGAASQVTPVLLRELGCKVVTINSHHDGHFPGRPPEPQPWNLTDLMRVVKDVGADLGIAHDGDADRVAAVDEKGNFIKHDALIAIFAEEAVRKSRGGVVVTSVNTSVAIEEVVARAGGKTVRTGLGRFTEEMFKHGACFAGEPGKLVFREFGDWADGILGAAKLVELVTKAGKPISEIFRERVPDYPMFHQDLRCPDDRKREFMVGMKKYLLEKITDVKDILEVDGLRIHRRDGSWVLARVSGTEPKARVMAEARSQEELEELKVVLLEGVKKYI
ncbi:MAG: phosphoglucosamine mutase [Candidatus Hadarchaeales archaeon]